MPTQRPTRGHLPSYSGDLASEVRSWRRDSSRSGINLKGVASADEDEDVTKSPLTRLRVWLANMLAPSSLPTRAGSRGMQMRSRRANIFLLLICVCVVYYWTRSKSKSASSNAPTPHFDPQVALQDARWQKFRTSGHVYRSDGLLEVNPNGTHPIFDLITKAEAAWQKKLRKASATFQEAVEEYVHRYHRPPPKGFDKW